jgi:hypothetical protein
MEWKFPASSHVTFSAAVDKMLIATSNLFPFEMKGLEN